MRSTPNNASAATQSPRNWTIASTGSAIMSVGDEARRSDPRGVQMMGREGLSPQILAGFWSRMADIDEQIASCHADGYAADVDRLLEERARWQRERDELMEQWR
jgi:hypothetical protein